MLEDEDAELASKFRDVANARHHIPGIYVQVAFFTTRAQAFHT